MAFSSSRQWWSLPASTRAGNRHLQSSAFCSSFATQPFPDPGELLLAGWLMRLQGEQVEGQISQWAGVCSGAVPLEEKMQLQKHFQPLGRGRCLSQRKVQDLGVAGFAPIVPQVDYGLPLLRGAGVVFLRVCY